MPKAIATINFFDPERQTTKHIKVVVKDDYSIDWNYVGDDGNVTYPSLETHPATNPTIGEKVENFIDKVTGGQLKKCGGCERRKKLLNKLGGKNESETTESSGDAV